ncbi:MAG TPA: YezD family protein [Phycisphaerae bacterium]|nr:YezD family protein [Phycisphaerae bacterium]
MGNLINGRTVEAEQDWQSIVRQQVDAIRFGIVQIVVHEGRVVQVERTEKIRLQTGGIEPRR